MSYPIETKIALVREYEQGKKVADVSKTSGIPENSIYRWIREYHTIKTASSSFTPVEYYKLEAGCNIAYIYRENYRKHCGSHRL